jgi:hypothetical protein
MSTYVNTAGTLAPVHAIDISVANFNSNARSGHVIKYGYAELGMPCSSLL